MLKNTITAKRLKLSREIGAIYNVDHVKHINEDKGQRSGMIQQMTCMVSNAF
jgi:hypothetical protein